MRPWFASGRVVEATFEQVVATGSWPGNVGADPIDNEPGWRRAGTAGREIPQWTREKATAYSVTAYRVNPMAKAIIDTYTSFCVGDSGLKVQASNAEVGRVATDFWTDPANNLDATQDLHLRSQLLLGEQMWELMVGDQSGVVRFAPYDPSSICKVTLRHGNANWPNEVYVKDPDHPEGERPFTVVAASDSSGLREGEAVFWRPFRTLNTDVRGMPFLSPVLDWLDNYDMVLSNLMDRTALARYFAWDVTVEGSQKEVDEYVRQRGGMQAPPSGSVEIHSNAITWKPMSVSTDAEEDSVAAKAALTLVAGGSGLARTWLADPEDANRATSLTMAEPVRRRVGGVQNAWLGQMTELVRFAVDRAVAAKRLPAQVEAVDPKTGETYEIPASQSVIVTGPQIAAADAQITAQVLLNLSTGLEKLVQIGALSPEGAKVAARKAWEDYVGIPYRAELDSKSANPDDVATHADASAKQDPNAKRTLMAVR